MRKLSFITATIAGTAMLAACGGEGGSAGHSRDSIRAVGSSTVYPFGKAVSENFAKNNPGFKSPIIESTGTGAGMKLFCAGLGAQTPDIVNASRRMKKSEFADCQANGVTDIIELQVGLDGLALASAKNGIVLPLTTETVYKALAAKPYGKEQSARTWADVDPALPAERILVYGPPSTSGTRDSFAELILEAGCNADPAMKQLKETDEAGYRKTCTEVRNDGAYVDAGENDNLIVQKVEANPRALGIFGYSYLEENSDKMHGQSLNGVVPTYDNIASLKYPGAREMFIYVKKAHVAAIPGLKEFIGEWAKAWVPKGALAAIGLITSPAEKMARNNDAAQNLTTMTGDDLH